jgi:hypothetical protein
MLDVNVWSVEYKPFEEYAAVEDIQDPEQFSEIVEGKSLLHPFILLQHAFLLHYYLFTAFH